MRGSFPFGSKRAAGTSRHAARRRSKSANQHRRPLQFESLEARRLLTAVPAGTPFLDMQLDEGTVVENAGAQAATLTITRNNPIDLAPLTVSLSIDDATEATLPATISFAAGQTHTSVPVDVVDDNWLDGTQRTWLTASAPGYVPSTTTLDVLDHELLEVLFPSGGIVSELDGLAALVGSVTRSHELLSSSNLFVTHENVLHEYTIDDPIQLQQTYDVPYGSEARPESESARDAVVMPDGKVAVYNGTFEPFLSLLDPAADFWKHDETAQPSTEDVAGYGGVAAYEEYVFLTDMDTPDSTPSGIVRVNTFDKTSEPLGLGNNYIDVTLGWDGLLYGLVDDEVSVHVYDPGTLEQQNSIVLTTPVRGIAADEDGTLFTSAWDNHLYQFDADGQQLAQLNTETSLTDIDLAANGRIAAGSAAGNVILTDTSLATFESFTVGSSPTFVAFGSPTYWDGSVDIGVTSDDPSEIDTVTDVFMDGGAGEAAIILDAMDDALLDGPQTILISASALGYVDGNATITVTDYESLSVSFDQPSISEAGGATTARVSRSNIDRSQPVTVTLDNDDESEATVPSSVVIPANQEFVEFTISAVDDNVLDGTQLATITASASGYFSGQNTLSVTDQENLTIDIAAETISEGDGPNATTGTVTRNNSDTSEGLVLMLHSSDYSEAGVPSMVIIPANETTATFEVNAVDDLLLDGTISVEISASAANYASNVETLNVEDNETLSVTIPILIGGIPENAGIGAATGVISRPNTDIYQELVVQLISSDTSEAQVPDSVTIPAYESSAEFSIDAVDDNLLDGTIEVTISVSANDYISNMFTFDVADHEELSVTIANTSVSEHSGGQATTATVTRHNTDIENELIVFLSANDTTEVALPSQVTIPANASSVTFDVASVDDSVLDGTATVIVTASASGYIDGTDSLQVTDYEQLTISVDTTTIPENGGQATATVRRDNTDVAQPLTVLISASDASAVDVPASVIIPANESAATFAITAISDNVADGTQVVDISATAIGYPPATTQIDIEDVSWQNGLIALDVNNDGGVTPIDVLQLINDLNAKGSRELPAPGPNFEPPPYLDVNGDGVVSPVDALAIINHLNGAVGEGEASPRSNGSAAAVYYVPAGHPSADLAEDSSSSTEELAQNELTTTPQPAETGRTRDGIFAVVAEHDEDDSEQIEDLLDSIADDVASAWAI